MKEKILSPLLNTYAKWAGLSIKPYPDSVLLLPPYSLGSYGDVAVVTSFVENLVHHKKKHIALIQYKNTDDWTFINGISEFFCLEDFFHYNAWRIRFSFCDIVSKHEQFFVLGTDVMDGFYSAEDSLQRIYLTNLGAQTGRPSRITSFSFNAHPVPSCVTALRELPSSVKLFARDPLSKERLESHLSRPIQLTADVAFLLEPREGNISAEILRWMKQQEESGAVLVGINANHVLVERYPDLHIDKLVSTYQEMIKEISAEYPNIRFLFIPHDVRGEVSDVSIAEKIYHTLPQPLQSISKIVPSPCHPAEIKHIVSKVAFVLSGKMHLAIACLSQGVPVICIDYQDKFEGLFQHFDMKGMALAPEEILIPGRLSQFFLERFNQREKLSKQIKFRLPEVIQLAEKNLL